MNISVIVPTKNEVEGIASVISETRKIVGKNAQIIVVDEQSTDGTIEEALKADKDLIVIQRNGIGKGNAIKTVIPLIEGNIVIMIDSDATFDPLDIPKIIYPILKNKADVVLGSRIIGKMEEGSMNFFHYFGNRLFNFLLSLKYGTYITDSQTGLRAMRRRVFDSFKIVSDGFDIETELTIKCLKNGYKVIEVPINFYKRKGSSKSKLNTFSDGWLIFKRILFENF
ncbi:MAG: glycosyltransferase family 2 protein [Candidatus Hodarchaeota archaeon]